MVHNKCYISIVGTFSATICCASPCFVALGADLMCNLLRAASSLFGDASISMCPGGSAEISIAVGRRKKPAEGVRTQPFYIVFYVLKYALLSCHLCKGILWCFVINNI